MFEIEHAEYRGRSLESQLDEAIQRISRQQDAYTSFQDELFQELRSLIREEISNAVRPAFNDALVADSSTSLGEQEIVRVDHAHAESSLLGELAHAIKTPLAHIESTLRRLEAKSPSGHEAADLRDMLTSVELCKASLAAFRELRRISSATDSWSPVSFRESLKGASCIYSAKTGKKVTVDNRIPDTIPGYSNNYLLALVLPLLENAIEASPSGGRLELSLTQISPSQFSISVENDIEESVDVRVLYTPGATTKPGHDGLGVAIVQDLLKAYGDAKLVHSERDGRFAMTVFLPGGPGHD
jgi:signal transduction histidine kinase